MTQHRAIYLLESRSPKGFPKHFALFIFLYFLTLSKSLVLKWKMYSFPLKDKHGICWSISFSFTISTSSHQYIPERWERGFAHWDWGSMVIDPLRWDKAWWARTAAHTGRLPPIQGAHQLIQPNSNSSHSLVAVRVMCQCPLRTLNVLCYESVSITHELPFIIPIQWRSSGSETLSFSRSRGWMWHWWVWSEAISPHFHTKWAEPSGCRTRCSYAINW